MGDLTKEEAHMMHALAMNAMHGEDTNMTVHVSGSQMVVNLMFATDDKLLGILYQHANACWGCNQLATQPQGMFDDFLCCAISLHHKLFYLHHIDFS